MDCKDFILYKGAWIYEGAPHTSQPLSEGMSKKLLCNGGLLVRNYY